jgi:hypothetical protein
MMMQKSFCRLQFARIIAVLTSVSGPDPDRIRSQFVSESGSRQANMVPEKGGKEEILCSVGHFGGSWKLL